ncbi:hypothetical protein, partial [Erwinia amylovora]|uniref:hypothetical protein n=1 Tax=Erwinia amylovora TaxID=552 RepID=UPI0038600FDD
GWEIGQAYFNLPVNFEAAIKSAGSIVDNLRLPGLFLAEVILLVGALTESMAKQGGDQQGKGY